MAAAASDGVDRPEWGSLVALVFALGSSQPSTGEIASFSLVENDKSLECGAADSFGPILHAEFAVDIGEVKAYRRAGDMKHVGHFDV